MKAVFYRRFGDADVLEYGDLPEPKMGLDSVKIRIKAAAVNPVDWKAREGYLDSVCDTVFPVVPGGDFAGVVVDVGIGVTEFAAGDEVIGFQLDDYLSRGTFGEIAVVPTRAVTRKPARLGWLEAAALPLAGITAYQALVRALDVRRGQTVLVHAAAGGVGSVAVQIAVNLGARVIGTASPPNHEFVKSLGAEPVDYRRGLAESVAALAPGGVDAVLDAAGKRTLRTLGPLLRPGGRLASVVDPGVRSAGGHYVLARPHGPDLATVARMAADGAVKVEVSHTFPLRETAQAHRLSQGSHTRGKIVVVVDESVTYRQQS
ncbi:NADP-dependent oxidoreductase [Nocardia transvalensis]|uniref:NADP-dependent oxidoreductase n=1 Tax=Nocardia transvalensis TaxID=37333 RepID=UPI0018958BCC|nr:NADP-dependent oxidoreductase [Nocardia transvalensis]MBF6329913.1 NADP-dependent oxidoreductase [Nocardia transvalensis]